MKKIILAYFLWAFCIRATNAEELDFRPYMMNLGGGLSFPMKWTRHDEFHLGLKIAPSYGIFIANNWEQRVQFSLTANYVFSNQKRITNTPIFWDISWASIYYFPTGHRVRPYLGGGLGVGFMDLNIYSINILLDLPLGILVQLSTDLALDVGIPLRVRVSPRAFFDSVEIPVGVIGLRYFFNRGI